MFQNNVQRVKVYRLTNDGQWDDQGTGHITIDYIEVWSTLDSYLLETSSKMITAIFVSYWGIGKLVSVGILFLASTVIWWCKHCFTYVTGFGFLNLLCFIFSIWVVCILLSPLCHGHHAISFSQKKIIIIIFSNLTKHNGFFLHNFWAIILAPLKLIICLDLISKCCLWHCPVMCFGLRIVLYIIIPFGHK